MCRECWKTFPPRDSDPEMHHRMCVAHVPWCIPGSLTSGFLWSRWRRKRSRHSPAMHNPKFYVSGERSMGYEGVSSVQCILDISRSHFSTILTMDTHTIARPSGVSSVNTKSELCFSFVSDAIYAISRYIKSDSLLPSDAIWRHRTKVTFVQVTACIFYACTVSHLTKICLL